VPWLVYDGKVLATIEVASSWRARSKGLLGRDELKGRDGLDGAIQLTPAKAVHTVRMRFPIDVAYCDAGLRVLRIARMRPNRIGRPTWRARSIIEAEAGAFGRWGVREGDQLEIRGGP
jgi:uncharacterized membrane protein (UPF0127 family)